MPTTRLCVLLISCCLTLVTAAEQDHGAQARQAVAAASDRPHPRLLADAETFADLSERVAGDPFLQDAADHVIAFAEAMLPLPPVARIMEGKRLLSQSRLCVKRILYLGLAHRLTGDRRFAERARAEMLAAAGFRNWNPSHFLDVGEMTAALGIGYDWLYHELGEEDRTTIRQAIVEKGLKPGFRGGWWVTKANNWNPVCHGGLAIGALAVAEDAPGPAERTLARSLEHLPIALHEYGPDGAYPEGPGYYQYGTTYMVLALAALESACGTSFGLAESPGFLQSPGYHLHVTGPFGRYFRYYDMSDTHYDMLPAMHWFARRTGDASLLWWEQPAFTAFLASDGEDLDPTNRKQRFVPLVLLWGLPTGGDRIAPASNHWIGHGPCPVAMHRSSWSDPDASFVAIKGGSVSNNHSHMDMGTFAVDMLGERWAEDLGKEKYNKLEQQGLDIWDRGQGSDRWRVFRHSAPAHNVLVVDDQELLAEPHASIIASEHTGDRGHTLVDLGPVYAFALSEATRGVKLLADGSVLIQDEFTADADSHTVRWGMVTAAEIEIEAPDRATLTIDDEQITARLLAPADASFSSDNLNPPNEWDEPNDQHLLKCVIDLPAAASARIVVQLLPPGAEPATVTPLAEW